MAASRLLPLGAVAVVALALAGFLVGAREPVTPWTPPERTAEHGDGIVLPAVRYADMDGKASGPNRHYVTDLRTLASPSPKPTDAVVQTEADKAAALAKRAARRAYAGAPPTIPHPVDGNDVASCYACHGDGKQIGTIIAPKISHQRYTNCTQCHAQAATPTPGDDIGFLVENHFTGLPSPTRGERAYAGAPPQIPHPTHMRENCTSCHGVLGQTGIRSTHPWRANCTQCHAPSAAFDQRLFGDGDAPPVSK